MEVNKTDARRGFIALSPIIVFLLLYLVVSLVTGDFYSMPISVAMAAGAVWGVTIMGRKSLGKRIEVFTSSAANPDILYMICIFILAGAFARLAGQIGAVDATVDLTLQIFPADFIVAGLFMAACFISLSIGTSVGTVVALTPLAVEVASSMGADSAFYVAVVLGGSFFGDNLSFISDTTIAATRSQGCKMNDKFKANLWIAVPAAVIALIIYLVMGHGVSETVVTGDTSPWLVIPYLAVILMAVCGINVTVVLITGILIGFIAGLAAGFSPMAMAGFLGEGIDSMGDLIIVTLIAAGMLGLVNAMGGITFILKAMTSKISSSRGAQGCIAVLVGIVNLCTANNTIAIITVGSISRDIAGRFGVDPRKSASLLDTSSCIVQCLIPYGAQTLLATSLAGLSPIAPFPYLYYPWILSGIVLLSIVLGYPRHLSVKG